MSDQKPSIGRIVHVPAAALRGCEMNGADVAPAVITRVWSDAMVNVRVLLDGNDTPWKTSIALYQSREDYDRAAQVNGRDFGCYWPGRV